MSTTEYRVAMLPVDPPVEMESEDGSIRLRFDGGEQIVVWTETEQDARDYVSSIVTALPDSEDLLQIQTREVTDWVPLT